MSVFAAGKTVSAANLLLPSLFYRRTDYNERAANDGEKEDIDFATKKTVGMKIII